MTDKPEAEDALVLEQDAWAVVWSADKGWRLLMPAIEIEAPDEAVAILGAFLRLSEDAEFRDACAAHAIEAHCPDGDGETVH